MMTWPLYSHYISDTHQSLNLNTGVKAMSRNDNKAVIWDMDGVIVDTALSHFSSWQNVFKKMGVKYTEEDFRRNFGQRNDTIIRNILGKDIFHD